MPCVWMAAIDADPPGRSVDVPGDVLDFPQVLHVLLLSSRECSGLRVNRHLLPIRVSWPLHSRVKPAHATARASWIRSAPPQAGDISTPPGGSQTWFRCQDIEGLRECRRHYHTSAMLRAPALKRTLTLKLSDDRHRVGGVLRSVREANGRIVTRSSASPDQRQRHCGSGPRHRASRPRHLNWCNWHTGRDSCSSAFRLNVDDCGPCR